MKPNHKPASFQGFTGSHLKWMALSSMFLDHIGAVLIENALLPGLEELPADCARNCTRCGRCEEILKKALVRHGN